MDVYITNEKLLLYFDDSGSRDPNHTASYRTDGMDWFGLGGVLLEGEAIGTVLDAHAAFCQKWKISYPLHSTHIRGARKQFSWLGDSENPQEFLQDLEKYILAQPITCLACVIHRPDYVARYGEKHKGEMWLLCKTAFTILAERAAKYADMKGRKLEIYFEKSGRKEDRNIHAYLRELKATGSPFSPDASAGYSPLTADDFRRIVIGDPNRKTKAIPMLQLADLVLYPMAKGGYDTSYAPYVAMKEAGRLIDCHLKEEAIPTCGIKYSCFDQRKI